jgi:hypothetical protein
MGAKRTTWWFTTRPWNAMGASLTTWWWISRPSTSRRDRPHTLSAVIRQCSRPGCAEDATATLSYEYGTAVAWLDDLAGDRNPHDYDLCPRHTRTLSVPRGWQLEDRRGAAVVPFGHRLAG